MMDGPVYMRMKHHAESEIFKQKCADDAIENLIKMSEEYLPNDLKIEMLHVMIV
jgi:hypothetical protein